MNERIEELAGIVCDILDDGDWNIPDEFIENFAKLIVRECIDVARPNYMSVSEAEVHHVEQAIDRITDHFGVEK